MLESCEQVDSNWNSFKIVLIQYRNSISNLSCIDEFIEFIGVFKKFKIGSFTNLDSTWLVDNKHEKELSLAELE